MNANVNFEYPRMKLKIHWLRNGTIRLSNFDPSNEIQLRTAHHLQGIVCSRTLFCVTRTTLFKRSIYLEIRTSHWWGCPDCKRRLKKLSTNLILFS